MRKILIEYAQPGMTLAKTVFTTNGVVLLNAGVQLRSSYVVALKQAGIAALYIEDALSSGVIVEDLVSDETKYAAKKLMEESFQKSKADQLVNSTAIQNIVRTIVEQILMKPAVMVNLQDIRSKDEFLFAHSVNVCVLSVLIGKKMGYTYDKLRELAVGAMLHDLGKVRLESPYYRHRTDFEAEDREIYGTHCRIGFDMLKRNREISVVSAYIALAHHEKYDGTGFPLGQKGTKIHEFARIVALVNAYDNMLYNPAYGTKMKHYQILEYIASRAYMDFDPQVVKIFQESVSIYPIGTGVILNTGEKALVVKVHPNIPSRPTVRVIGKKEDKHVVIREVDLLQELTTFIVDEIELV